MLERIYTLVKISLLQIKFLKHSYFLLTEYATINIASYKCTNTKHLSMENPQVLVVPRVLQLIPLGVLEPIDDWVVAGDDYIGTFPLWSHLSWVVVLVCFSAKSLTLNDLRHTLVLKQCSTIFL